MKPETRKGWQGTTVVWSPSDHPGQDFTWLGRNGCGTCEGLYAGTYGPTVSLQPITSKGELARCRIDLPLAEFLKLAAAVSAKAGAHNNSAKPVTNLAALNAVRAAGSAVSRAHRAHSDGTRRIDLDIATGHLIDAEKALGGTDWRKLGGKA
jgi:hypothetical protein